jgi:uncharacterized protein (TIGR03086 family)
MPGKDDHMVPEGFVRALDGFETVLAAVPDDRWDAPSPCEDWVAIEVVGHVISALLAIHAHATGSPLTDIGTDLRALAGEDPRARWRRVRADMMAELGPGALARTVDLPWEDDMTLREFVDRYPLEILVHTWDLAEATGQSVTLGPDLVRAAIETAEQYAPLGREAGLIGPERDVPDGADDQTRLLALFGRG